MFTKMNSQASTTVYDSNGNMTTMPEVDVWGTSQTLTYDAWNRPITVAQSGVGTLGTYAYDGLNRRITKTISGATRHFYYSKDWQVLEEDLSGSMARQYVWGTRYRDDLILRDRRDGSTDRYYALSDYFQTTALADTGGTIQERYVYRAFGDVSYYDGSFTHRGSSSYAWSYLYGGYLLDLETNLYQVRNRYYHSALGRWLSRDPIGEVAGTNLYAYVFNNAVNRVDSSGLEEDVYPIYPKDDTSPLGLGIEWLTGTGSSTHNYEDGDDFTEQVKQHKHVKEVRQKIKNTLKEQCSSCDKTDISKEDDYSLSGVQGVPQYISDATTVLDGGATGNLAGTFLGSYQLHYDVKQIKCCQGTAMVHFHIHNESTIASATRPPVLGYTKWWNKNVGTPLNNTFSSGPLSPTFQNVDWDESVTFTANSDCST